MRQQNHYDERVNRVLDYIAGHLHAELSLRKLSRIGCFSPYHFHRIFQAITGETLNSHVRRVRLERSASLLKASPRKRITDAALEAGFAGTAEFSRAFQSHFGRTASSCDRRSPLEKSKICKEPGAHSFYSVEELEQWMAGANLRVRVQPSGAFRYANDKNRGEQVERALERSQQDWYRPLVPKVIGLIKVRLVTLRPSRYGM